MTDISNAQTEKGIRKCHTHQQKLSFAVDLVSTYNSQRVTPTTHLSEWTTRNKIYDEITINFLENILYGIDRRNHNLNRLCDSYYQKHRRKTLKEDYNLYCIFIYLIVFYNNDTDKSQQIDFKKLKPFILASDCIKMVNFLTFIFEESLNNHFIENALRSSFDPEYVETRIIQPMLSTQPKIKQLLIEISQKNLLRSTSLSSSNDVQIDFKGGNKATSTKPKPFKLTKTLPQVKPKTPPLPKQFKSQNVPKTTYSVSIDTIESKKQKRKEKIKEQTTRKYELYDTQSFEFETAKRPSNLETIRQTVNQQIEASMKGAKVSHKVPNMNKDCPVRMNVAAILREDALFQKEQKKQAQLLKEFEFGLRDSTEFDEWKEKELLTDEIEKVRMIQARKHEMQQSAVLAKKAVEAIVAQKYIEAQQMNVEAMKKQQEKSHIDRQIQSKKREIAQKIKSDKENALLAVEKHEAQNKEIRDDVIKQSKKMRN
eukprot:310439_1